jgi:hypothetical protein
MTTLHSRSLSSAKSSGRVSRWPSGPRQSRTDRTHTAATHVSLDPELTALRSELQALLGPSYSVEVDPERVATIRVTCQDDADVIRKMLRRYPFIIAVAFLDNNGRHDHKRLVDAVNVGLAAYLVDPSSRLLAAHIRCCRFRDH